MGKEKDPMKLIIAQLGQPVLRQKVQPVPPEDIPTVEFQQLLDDMRQTLREYRGAGLAGPQVFTARRVFLAAILPPARENDPPEIEVFINPNILFRSTETAYSWEGCLSFVELLVLVERSKTVRIEYLNEKAEPKALELSGFPARVVQHEYDHLEGILTLDRVPDNRYIVKASEIEAFMEGEKKG